MGNIFGLVTATGRWIALRANAAGQLLVSAVLTFTDEPFWLITDKDDEFTGAIIQNAKEDENLEGLVADKIVITDIMIEAEENLEFYLLFWSTDDFDNADLDIDTFLGYVVLDIPNNGYRIAGANQYYLNVSDVNFHYEDEDSSNELHISLLNRSVAAKSAGGAGAVKIKIGYKDRE